MTLFIPDVSRTKSKTRNGIDVNMVPLIGWKIGERDTSPITLSPISSFWTDLWSPVAHHHDGLWHVYDRTGRSMLLPEWTAWAEQHLSELPQQPKATVNEMRDGTDREVNQHHVRGHYTRTPTPPGAEEPVAWTIMKGLRVGDVFTRSEAAGRVIAHGGQPGSVNGPLSFMTRCGWLAKAGPGLYEVLREVRSAEDSKYPRLRADGVPHRPIPSTEALLAAMVKARNVNARLARLAVVRYAPSGQVQDVRRDDRIALLDDLRAMYAEAKT